MSPLPVSAEAREMLDEKRAAAEVEPEEVTAPRRAITVCSLCGRQGLCTAEPDGRFTCDPFRSEKCVDITLTRIANKRLRERNDDGRLGRAVDKRYRRQIRNLGLIALGAVLRKIEQ